MTSAGLFPFRRIVFLPNAAPFKYILKIDISREWDYLSEIECIVCGGKYFHRGYDDTKYLKHL